MRGIPLHWNHGPRLGEALEARRINRHPMRRSTILLVSLATIDVLATILALMSL